jgi:serine/threonine-protein kinase
VYLADDIPQRRQVAVKVLHDSLVDDQEFIEKFRKETEIAASLTHPNVIDIYEWGEGEIPFTVMEYLSGGTLQEMFHGTSALTVSQAVVIGIAASEGLDYVHKRGIVQRELKPEKILFDSEGRVKLGGFVLAADLSGPAPTEKSKYASPEHREEKTIGTASDMYSLALILTELVLGKDDVGRDAQTSTSESVSAPAEAIFGSITPAITQALAHEPSARPDAETFRDMLVEASKELSRPDPLPIKSGLGISITTPVNPGDADANKPQKRTPFTRIKKAARFVASRFRRWTWLLLMAALIAGVISIVYVNDDEEIINIREVPDVTGLTTQSLLDQASSFWELEEALTRADGSTAGTILKTIPLPGELLEEGETLTYFVSQGSELRDIPLGLTGLSIQDAEAALLGARLTLGAITQQSDEDIGIGLVIGPASQDSEMPTGSPVDLIVSSGPELRTIPVGLEGNSFEEAETALVLEGLQVRKQEVYHPTIPEGIVVMLNPASGNTLLRDSFVDLIVSRGPEPLAE